MPLYAVRYKVYDEYIVRIKAKSKEHARRIVDEDPIQEKRELQEFDSEIIAVEEVDE